MGKENKVSLVIFTLFLVYGVQGYFTAKAFIIPFFLNKLFYLLAAIIFLVIYFADVKRWSFDSEQVDRPTITQKSIWPYIILIFMSIAWVIGDPYSTEFLAYTFNSYEGFMIFENFYFILLSLIVFLFCLGYFTWKIFILYEKIPAKILIIVLYSIAVICFISSNPLWLKILLPALATGLAYAISKKSSKSIEIFSAWLNLVALLELLTLLIPASRF